ncbi:hypothetical protein QUF74_10485 [Candidatus Halobeggiatoa sp. HSG11]|nr:hypothetical protein [Candidatus Halobeggiatoa sp. HSG11]
MQTYQIEIETIEPSYQMISVTLLQALLWVITEGSKGALRLCTEGRSTVRGAPPQWIKHATNFSIAFKDKKLYIQSPTLYEVAPELFNQEEFAELNSERTSLDYFQDSLATAVLSSQFSQQEMEESYMLDSLYDKALLEVFYGFHRVFHQGAKSIRFLNGNGIQMTPDSISTFRKLKSVVPYPCQIKIIGILDSIRNYDRTFNLTTNARMLRGVSKNMLSKETQDLVGKEVLISGTAYFTSTGKALRIEADKISVPEGNERILWEKLPLPAIS